MIAAVGALFVPQTCARGSRSALAMRSDSRLHSKPGIANTHSAKEESYWVTAATDSRFSQPQKSVHDPAKFILARTPSGMGGSLDAASGTGSRPLQRASVKSRGYVPLSYEAICPVHIPSIVPMLDFRQILKAGRNCSSSRAWPYRQVKGRSRTSTCVGLVVSQCFDRIKVRGLSCWIITKADTYQRRKKDGEQDRSRANGCCPTCHL